MEHRVEVNGQSGNDRGIDLCQTAQSIAARYGDKGAIVISVHESGIRLGAEGLTLDELRDALRLAIRRSAEFEKV